MEKHYTAWLTTDAAILDTDMADVAIVADERIGDDDEGWTSTGETLMRATTTAQHGDHDAAMREAERLINEAGWQLVDSWTATGNGSGYSATVTKL